MPFLFDTDVLSAVIRRAPDLAVLRRLGGVPDGEKFTTAISYGELLFGAIRRNRADLLQRIRALPDSVPVLPFDQQSAEAFAELKTELERGGAPLAEPDLRIASIAVAYGLTLVTGNERHFRRVANLTLENWLL